MTNRIVCGIDVGRPGGDMTAISARCPCGRLWTMSWEAAFEVKPVSLHCVCGLVSSLALPDEPAGISPAGAADQPPTAVYYSESIFYFDHRAARPSGWYKSVGGIEVGPFGSWTEAANAPLPSVSRTDTV